MNCVILQPSYVPWRGYFHQIYKADCFIFYDDVQYDARGWRNRNRIKTPQGPRWLTVPVYSKGCQVHHTPICDIHICADTPWQMKHWHTLEHAYRKAPFFEYYAPLLREFYEIKWELLADLTIELTIALARELGIQHTRFVRSSMIEAHGTKTERLVDLLVNAGATHYITGPSARSYIEEEKFQEAGITLEYMRYDYPEYAQLHPPYDGQVSILDLLFMTGPNALDYIAAPADVPEPEPDADVLSGFHVVDSAACQARSGSLFEQTSPQPLQTDTIKSSFRDSL
jgi:hypothetical protein